MRRTDGKWTAKVEEWYFKTQEIKTDREAGGEMKYEYVQE